MVSCLQPEDRALGNEALAHRSGELWFRQLYRTHFDEVIKLALRFGIARHDAEDITQRVFLVAHRHLETYEQIEHPSAWLRAITIRIIREHYRWWRLRHAASWLLEFSWAGRAREELTPERDAVAGESLAAVREVLLLMSDKLREALVLLDIEDLSPREAAELLRVPQNTLRSRRALAREEFRRLWERAQRRKGSPHD